MKYLEINGDPYLPAKVAAAELKLSESTLRCWRSRGRYAKELPFFKRFDGKIYYKIADIEALKIKSLH